MSNNLTTQSGYHGLLAANNLTQNVKHFEGLFTQVAVSENGYIAIYYPHEPERKAKIGVFKTSIVPEQQERLELFHVSQINDFDIEIDGDETTHVSGGAGGAVVGGLLGGALGAVIGSSLTSGTVTSNTTINGISLIINTKDFNNPRVETLLYKRISRIGYCDVTSYYPFALRKHYTSKGMVGTLDKEGDRLRKEIYDFNSLQDYKPNIAQIEALYDTLTQMLAAQQQSETATSAAPQISSADELMKFKALLDSGVITQEEFDAKKKQLLGL